MVRRLRAIQCSGSVLVLALIAVAANATTVPFPYIDVISLGTADDVSSTGGALNMTGTASAIVQSLGVQLPISPQATFTLNAQYSAALTSLEAPGSNTYDFTNGSITVNNGTNLLTASFNDLQLTSLSSGTYQLAIGSGPLSYTNGTLAGALTGGTLLGSFIVDAYTANSNGVANLSDNFTGYDLTAKVGAVVPLPAAFPLLLSGLGLLGGWSRWRRRTRLLWVARMESRHELVIST